MKNIIREVVEYLWKGGRMAFHAENERTQQLAELQYQQGMQSSLEVTKLAGRVKTTADFVRSVLKGHNNELPAP